MKHTSLTKNKQQMTKWSIASISLLLYATSCFFPAFTAQTTMESEACPGWLCLIVGWIGCLWCFACPWNLVWISNPLYILAILYFTSNRHNKYLFYASATCILAILVGFSFVFCHSLMLFGNNNSHIWTRCLGYYLWVSSFLVLFIGIIIYTIIYGRNKDYKK